MASQVGFPSSSRYTIITKIASGGMATVYVGALRGSGGFERVVAIKRAHPHLLEEPSCRVMLLEEARLASKIDHPNVIGVRDVEEVDGELLLVMDYVEGASLAKLLYHADSRLPSAVAVRIILDACAGLAAVHEMAGSLVHRDVSPQNILVGVDGVSRISDFGIAKSTDSPWFSATRTGGRRGKPGYMAPEYVDSGIASPLGDVFGAGVVAWEALTSRRLFRGATDGKTLDLVKQGPIAPPSQHAADVTPEIDAVILRATERDPSKRFQTVTAFAEALEEVASKAKLIASRREVQRHVNARTSMELDMRRSAVRAAMSSDVFLIGKRAEAEKKAKEEKRASGAIPIATFTSAPAGKSANEDTTRRVSLRELQRRTLGQVELAEEATTGAYSPKAKTVPPSARALADSLAPSRTSKRWLAVVGCAVVLAGIGGAALLGHHPALAGSTVAPSMEARELPPVAASFGAAGALEVSTAPAPASESAETAAAAKPVPTTPHADARPSAAPIPTDCEALTSLGDARRTAGDASGAATYYAKAIELNPRFLPARIALADVRWEGGRRAEAADLYRALVEQFAPSLLPQRARDRSAKESAP